MARAQMNTGLSTLPVYFYSYGEIETFCLSKREQLSRENVGFIIGVLRGGGIPALMLSQMLGIPVDFLHYNRREARVEIANTSALDSINLCIKEGKRVLLVEDVAGVGYTLVNCYDYLLTLVKDRSLIKTLTLVHHENSRATPDHYRDCSAVRAVLPWERYITGHEFMDDFSTVKQAPIGDRHYKKTLAIDNPNHPLDLSRRWKIDHHLQYDGNERMTMGIIRTIGPEEVYCNTESLIDSMLNKLPFITVYKTINRKRYRISALD